MTDRAKRKISGRGKLAAHLARKRSRGERIVFTSGCYDLLHIGHLRGFEQARSLGDVLVVGVNRDRRVRELKGRGRPIVSERQRAELIAGFECVDHVVLFGEDTAAPLIRSLRPDIVCKGGEYRGWRPAEQEAIESLGGEFVLLRQVPGIRSSALIKRLRE
jgi:D-beta-D-heptose 7-phosphate kinase/D-beta-D-heptose 1-phosphate adenosyltransferase